MGQEPAGNGHPLPRPQRLQYLLQEREVSVGICDLRIAICDCVRPLADLRIGICELRVGRHGLRDVPVGE